MATSKSLMILKVSRIFDIHTGIRNFRSLGRPFLITEKVVLATMFARAQGETLTRFGDKWEDAVKLAEQAAAAEAHPRIGIHGVSVTASPTPYGSKASRTEVEKVFKVHDTPTRGDKHHKTVELPKPVTDEVVEQFNTLFGRPKPG